jgi:hypothetical protein
MELDNLKAIWKAQDTLPEIQPDMQQLLQKRSRGHIARMRRNVRVEALAMLISYIPCIVLYLAWFEGRLWFISLMMSMILVCYFIYFLRKDRLLKKMQCVTCEVRSNLARQVKILEKYLRFYLWTTTLVIIISWAHRLHRHTLRPAIQGACCSQMAGTAPPFPADPVLDRNTLSE